MTKERLYSLDLLRGADMFLLVPAGSSAFQTWHCTWFLTSLMFGAMTLCGHHATKILQTALRDFRPRGKWILSPAFRDDYASDRLRWQFRTLRYNE